ncbi:hypothetical protein ACFFMP_16690 [Pseudoroseomonas cervicalis]|uniref:Uncharacterized protein n=1 Tax=Pseudoroseomonas cervicalis ATCC 49957 TaxID=525371 RepID=D5RH39_9PROT|nr:hypothetical protein [Pseudoroseomonas cervicalis]EFH13380.1 hypothetical protein HMPREF0731_0398 [Pseudoroseomonas cervicalis ATCC 49957]
MAGAATLLAPRALAALVALALAGGEIARRLTVPGGVFPGFIPLALDEFAIAAALLWGAWSGRALPLVIGWASCAGLLAGLLAANAAPLLGGAPKPGALAYTLALSALLGIALWGVWRSGKKVQ